MTKVMLGGDTQLLWATENGTFKNGLQGTMQWFGYMTEEGPHSADENEGLEAVRYIGAGGRNIGDFLLGPTDYTGTIRVDKLQEITMAPYAFGKLAQAGSPTSTRTVTESGTLPSFAFEEAQQATAGSHMRREYSGVKINKYTLSCREGEELTQEVDYIAGSRTLDTTGSTAVTVATDVAYAWDDFQINISGAGLSGKIDTLKEFSWTLNNNLDAQHYLNGTRNVGEPVGGNRDYEFTATFHATHGSAYDWYKNMFVGGSQINVDLYCFRTSGTDDFTLIMSGVQLMDCDQPSQPGGQLKQTWTATPTSCALVARTAATGSWAWGW